jgi:heme-degrading monooxygenase HmoA
MSLDPVTQAYYVLIGPFGNEFLRRKRRGINRRILLAPRGGVLNLYPPLEDSSAAGGLKTNRDEEDLMAVKILIRRKIPEDKARKMIPLFREMRSMANQQPGYITGETMRNLEKPDEFLVISTWETSEDWKRWVESDQRKQIQDQIDALLGGKTEYEIFHYGFAE